MSASTGLLLFLLFDCFIVGMLATVALRHGLAHFRPAAPAPAPNTPAVEPLSRQDREHMVDAARHSYQNALDKSTVAFDHDLEVTSDQINKQVRKLASAVVGEELERYRIELVAVRKQAVDSMEVVQKALDAQRVRLEAELAADMKEEKQRLITLMDTRLSEAVSSFLVETLQHEVDLGAQSKYLVEMLEAHKQELQQEVAA